MPLTQTSGFLSRAQFPAWLGRNSTRTKHKRYLSELSLALSAHLRLSPTQLRKGRALDLIYRKCVAALGSDAGSATESASRGHDTLASFGLTRDLLVDNLQSLRLKGEANEFDKVPAGVKSALTRLATKANPAKGRSRKAAGSDDSAEDIDMTQLLKKPRSVAKAKAKARARAKTKAK